jgi:hypothetical protein
MPYKDKGKQRAAQQRSYQRNKDRYLAEHQLSEWKIKRNTWAANKRAEIMAHINAQKEVPCADCGVQYPPYVMDFDHVRGEKFGSVNWLVAQRYRLEVIQEEIDKCEVVCSNCHRERTHGS